MPSVNSVCIVNHKQVEVRLRPADPMLSWKERRVVKALNKLHFLCPAELLLMLLNAK